MTTLRSSNKSYLVVAAAAALAVAPLIWVARAEPPASDSPRAASDDAGADRGRGHSKDGHPKDGHPKDGLPKDGPSSKESAKVRRDATQPGPAWANRPFVPGWGPRGSGMGMRAAPPIDWTEVSAFMARYAPWGTREVNQMPEGEWKERIKASLTQRYRALRLLESRDPETFEQRLVQLGIEDEALRLVSTFGGADEAQREAIRDDLRTRAARLVELDLQERQRRVQRLEDELKKQKDALDRDTGGRDGLVDKRVKGFMDWGKRWAANRARADRLKARTGGATGGADGKPGVKPDAGAEKGDAGKGDEK